ncbi:nickel-responsive transcriptional regulator NikR [Paenibacillus sp. LHD-117]|uniref:nickel-responsive transcriptional regulator NikR n=1 Tax=Paenibacillus sp. LHD-117 TaxID=3071412 RepID=UPI0027E07B01|nr:nickel-responsive transcriptional regulator NikR [Paenibacillus sp. LHD-117]MDQ6419072.1 nickel-responsive transcriptional regulator NikR [Paenibacillus sp. LHD-117]
MADKDKDELVRFGVSFPAPLIGQFDRFIEEQGYQNRSEAIRDLARKALLEPARLSGDEFVAGTIVVVYDHHVRELPVVLMDIQHDYHHDIVSNMHVHLNHDQCLEVIVVRGRMEQLRQLHERIQIQKGVSYAELSVTFADKHGDEGAADHRDHHHHSHQHDSR